MKHKEGTFVKDVFDPNCSFGADTECVFCHGGSDVGQMLYDRLDSISTDIFNSDSSSDEIETGDSSGAALAAWDLMDPKRIWMANYALPLGGDRKGFVHFYCALYSPATWLRGTSWHNLGREVHRSRHFKVNCLFFFTFVFSLWNYCNL